MIMAQRSGLASGSLRRCLESSRLNLSLPLVVLRHDRRPVLINGRGRKGGVEASQVQREVSDLVARTGARTGYPKVRLTADPHFVPHHCSSSRPSPLFVILSLLVIEDYLYSRTVKS